MSDAFETLKNMNATTAKFANWVVRVLDPKIIKYSFKARSENVNAEKFQCMLGSANSSEFMLGAVPFSFSDRDAAGKALKQYKDGHVFAIQTPQFDTKAKAEYISCPIKRVLFLNKPTTCKPVNPTQTAKLNHPAKAATVDIKLLEVMRKLEQMRTIRPASGSQRLESCVLNVCGKIIMLGPQKTVAKAWKMFKVATM